MALSINRKSKKFQRLVEAISGYLFIAPSLVVLLVFVFIPAFYVIYLSLFDWNLISVNKIFVGFGNYIKLFTSYDFLHSLWLTIYFTVVTVPVSLAISLFIALLLTARIRAKAFFRMGFFIPYITPLVATSIIWIFIFNPTYGLLNFVLSLLGIKPLEWLISTTWAMPAVMIYSMWHEIGFATVVFMAGLSNVPQELKEASYIDGANAFQTFKHVIWPLLSPTTFFLVIINIIGAFKMFTQINVLTQGGPVDATTTTGYLIYKEAFQFYHIGYASAISIALFFIIFALTLIQMRLTGRKVFYG